MQAITDRRAAEAAGTTMTEAALATKQRVALPPHRGNDDGDDVEAARALFNRTGDAIDEWALRLTGGRETDAYGEWLDLRWKLDDAAVILADQAFMAVARVVGAYLVKEGKTETWRALFLLLLARFDFWGGWNDGYELGDEITFLEESGGWARDQAAEQATEEAKAAEGVPA
jgi:hypothetical protein